MSMLAAPTPPPSIPANNPEPPWTALASSPSESSPPFCTHSAPLTAFVLLMPLQVCLSGRWCGPLVRRREAAAQPDRPVRARLACAPRHPPLRHRPRPTRPCPDVAPATAATQSDDGHLGGRVPSNDAPLGSGACEAARYRHASWCALQGFGRHTVARWQASGGGAAHGAAAARTVCCRMRSRWLRARELRRRRLWGRVRGLDGLSGRAACRHGRM
jgi:hypothetical protein